jgi:hypothetical protein
MKFITILIVAMSVLLLSTTAACADPQPITVTISARDPNGNPIQDMPLQCLTNIGAAFGITGVDIGHSITVSGKHYANMVPDSLYELASGRQHSATHGAAEGA